WSVERDPIAPVHDELIAVERRFIADDDAIVFRVQFDDVHRFGRSKAEAFALADGVKLNALMLAENVAVQIDDVAAMLLRGLGLREEPAVIFVGHETNFHALFLVGGFQIAMPRDFAGVALGFFAERKHRARELVLPQREEKITLVLARIA